MNVRRSVALAALLSLGLAPAAQAAPSSLYGDAANYPGAGAFGAGFGSTGVASGDLDGDGPADLAVVDFSSGVSVLRNLGDGSFDAPAPHATGTGTSAVAIAELDEEPGADLAVVNAMAGTLTVLSNNGDGSFATGDAYRVGQSAIDVVAADFDGDGRADIAVPFSRAVVVLRNAGGGRFDESAVVDTGGGAVNLAVGDFDGDDVLDLAVGIDGAFDPALPGGARVQMLLGQGDATFASGGSTGIPGFLEGLTAGDVNGDGHLDVIGADAYSQAVTVLLGNGDGTLAAPVPSPAGYGPTDVVVADVDGDGVPDAIVGNYFPSGPMGLGLASEVTVLHGAGDGTFAVVEKHAVGYGPQTVIADDLDGDGTPDLALAGSSRDVSVLLHQ